MTDSEQESVLSPKDADSEQPPTPVRAHRLVNVALVIGSLIVSVVLAEVGARVYAAIRGSPTSAYDFRLTRPAPYRDSPFFSEAFMEEQRRQPGGYKVVERGVLIPNDFRGKFYNVVDGVRRTTDQPAKFEHRILVFGGSTVYGAEVPDGFTIPSSLQRFVNQHLSQKYQVINYGVDSAEARQQLDRLQMTDVRAGDVVVFYDGVNESSHGVYQNNVGDTMYDAIYDRYERSSPFAKVVYSVYRQLRHRSQLVREFFIAPQRLPDHMKDIALVEELARKTNAAYRSTLWEAHQYVSSKGATFVHFLQPNLFSKPTLTPYETDLVKNHYLVFPGIETALKSTYPMFKDSVEWLRTHGVSSFDLSSVLDARSSPGQELYLDAAHVNEEANTKVAGEILGGIRAALAGQP